MFKQKKSTDYVKKPEINQDDLQGFAKTITLIEWLLLILILFYLVIHRGFVDKAPFILVPLVALAVFIVLFHYSSQVTATSLWRLKLETWVMIVFLGMMIWFTGKFESQLISLFLLPVIASALMLDKVTTTLQVCFIFACLLFVGYSKYSIDILHADNVTHLVEEFFPFVLVAYITAILSQDIKRTRIELKTLSETDQLTGLLNMRAFKVHLEKELERSVRHSRPFSLLMIDADGLKAINDTYGHEAGNKLIQHIAIHIQDLLRGSDFIARYGGDEFIVLLVETDRIKANYVAKRIGEHVAHSAVEIAGKKIVNTVSVGVATFPDDGDEIYSLIAKADRAMYDRKQGKQGGIKD